MKKHLWSWRRGWRFWEPRTARCLRCGARMRKEPLGPRAGLVYRYRGLADPGWTSPKHLPQCPGSPRDQVAAQLDAEQLGLYDVAGLRAREAALEEPRRDKA